MESFDRQLESIRAYAVKHGYEICRVFREEGISGTTDETSRPSLQALMAEILRDGVKTVIIEGLDRLARDLLIQQSLLAYMTSKGVTLIAASTGEDITESMKSDPMRRALAQIGSLLQKVLNNRSVNQFSHVLTFLNKGFHRVKFMLRNSDIVARIEGYLPRSRSFSKY